MKKEIVEQLLNEKPSILKTKFAQDSLHRDANYEKLSNKDVDFIYKKNEGKKTSRKLKHVDQLTFVTIYEAFSKRRKNINQFERAENLKFFFKKAARLGKFQYIYPYASKFNPQTNQNELIQPTTEEIEDAGDYGENFLQQIGLSQRLLVRRYGNEYIYYLNMLACLENIANYIICATPAAIVQMNKRLINEHKK